MEQSAMRHATQRLPHVLALYLAFSPAVSVFAQSGQSLSQTAAEAAATQSPATVRRLSIDEAVDLALEQNLGIRVERMNPRIQDVVVAQARTLWTPVVSSTLSNNSTTLQPNNAFAGGLTRVTDSRFATQFGVEQTLPTGTLYSLGWNNYRASSTNIFNNYDPQLSSTLLLNVTQPLLRNYKIDNVRQQVEVSRKDRDTADLQLRSTIVTTTRNVKNAYWELAYQIASLNAAQQSLDLAKRVLGDNEKRVQIGTMAPIDIVEAQSEVARNEESVIVAEALIKRAEDNLRALILDSSSPDFWTISIEPSESPAFQAQAIDVDAAVKRATGSRLDVLIARNNLERDDINIRYYRNQVLPDVNAEFSYSSSALGGAQLSPVTSLNVGAIERSVIARRSYGSVLGDVFSNAFPVWTLGLTISYPIGTSTAETSLARVRLQQERSQTQLRNLELQIATQVRDLARQVQTNQKRVETTRVARELAVRRLEAAEKKFAAGIETSFFVFQAQRDLSQARTNEVRAIADFNKSLVDFEAVQEAPLGMGGLQQQGSQPIGQQDAQPGTQPGLQPGTQSFR
jgi:outer membrane protein TolC